MLARGKQVLKLKPEADSHRAMFKYVIAHKGQP